MKNRSLKISSNWKVIRDEFYEIDPLDKTISDEIKELELFCQEDLLWIQKDNYNIDLGWYGHDFSNGRFGLYLYKGSDWHNCQLLEKIQTKKYSEIISVINEISENVLKEEYNKTNPPEGSIDDFSEFDQYSLLQINDGREKLKSGQYSVGHAYLATGHVLKTDKTIHQQRGAIFLNFDSKQQGINYIEKTVNENPDIECWMIDSLGEHVITIDKDGERKY